MNAALGRFAKDAQKELQRELRAVAEPVAGDIRGRLDKYGAAATDGVRAGSRSGAATVRQRAGKTTGLRPDFGALQMRKGFIPALEAGEPGVIRRVEDMLDRLAGGFNS